MTLCHQAKKFHMDDIYICMSIIRFMTIKILLYIVLTYHAICTCINTINPNKKQLYFQNVDPFTPPLPPASGVPRQYLKRHLYVRVGDHFFPGALKCRPWKIL